MYIFYEQRIQGVCGEEKSEQREHMYVTHLFLYPASNFKEDKSTNSEDESLFYGFQICQSPLVLGWTSVGLLLSTDFRSPNSFEINMHQKQLKHRSLNTVVAHIHFKPD